MEQTMIALVLLAGMLAIITIWIMLSHLLNARKKRYMKKITELNSTASKNYDPSSLPKLEGRKLLLGPEESTEVPISFSSIPEDQLCYKHKLKIKKQRARRMRNYKDLSCQFTTNENQETMGDEDAITIDISCANEQEF